MQRAAIASAASSADRTRSVYKGDCGESSGVVRLFKSETRARSGHPRLRKRKRCFHFSTYWLRKVIVFRSPSPSVDVMRNVKNTSVVIVVSPLIALMR